MDKEFRRIICIFIGLILCIAFLLIHYTGEYYKYKFKNDETLYYKAVLERDMYARMYYKEIGKEELFKKFEVE